ncbi:MAG: trypsin-like peptidase domain-containing protein [Candidatus Pacebacteria bacterium]|nr:trypsin-like peptidase domain-containing protein [Candidatus Paceibacterota bacterium]
MKEKIKSFINSSTVKVAFVSAITVVIILAITFLIAWQNRGTIFKYFASGYAQSTVGENGKVNDEKGSIATLPTATLPAVFSDEARIESAVERANPAVVAITVSKEVTKYKTSYQEQSDPFAQFFGSNNPFGFNFQIPVQTPDGTEKKQVGSGSGFIVSADGLIVTNKHVVTDKTAEYTVNLPSGKKYTAKVLARDAVLDIAILKIEATGLPHLVLADSSKLKLGQTVIAIGNALGQFENTVSVGVVSGLSRSITAGDGRGMTEALSHVIQTDAAINPGNSGGPLLDINGKVIGVNTAIVQGSQNIGFALPINSIKTVIDSVRTTGKIVRPYIGIRFQSVTPEMKEKNGLSVDYGVIVKAGADKNELAVIPGSPADKAGIVENDIILEIDGKKIDEDNNFALMIRDKKVGDSITLKVLSKGTEKKVTLILAPAPQD